LLVRRGTEFFAVGASCTHYSGPLAEGLVVRNEVRCPYHHARFSLDTGEAIGPPALNPVACFRTEVQNGSVFVREKKTLPRKESKTNTPGSIVIVGAG